MLKEGKFLSTYNRDIKSTLAVFTYLGGVDNSIIE